MRCVPVRCLYAVEIVRSYLGMAVAESVTVGVTSVIEITVINWTTMPARLKRKMAHVALYRLCLQRFYYGTLVVRVELSV